MFPGGFLGVDLFLVLSGFLITTLLLERHDRERRPIRTFYLRRALRLLPALAALLIANLLYAIIEGRGVGDALRSILAVGAYVTNWAELAGVHISQYVTHLWSLAIEEQFYLVWPLLLFAALARVALAPQARLARGRDRGAGRRLARGAVSVGRGLAADLPADRRSRRRARDRRGAGAGAVGADRAGARTARALAARAAPGSRC